MKISTGPDYIDPYPDKPAGGYEWWYFDGLSKDGSAGFVIIFYQGNPFSTRYIEELPNLNAKPEEYPAISISIYRENKTIYYSFLEFERQDYMWHESEKRLSIGADSFSLNASENEVEVDIELNQKLASGHYIKGTIKFKSERPDSNLVKYEHGDKKHYWNPVQLRAEVSGDLVVNGKELKYQGTGYHDHNTGLEPMKQSFKDWYWGRYHFKESTLIYYVMNGFRKDRYKAWLIDERGQKVIEAFNDIKTLNHRRNWFGLNPAGKIEIKSRQAEIIIHTGLILDNGPFYQRFLGNAVMKRNEQVYAAHGISEYIYPEKIYDKKFWPLVHMRLRFMNQKPHWVQKSKLLYPWTW